MYERINECMNVMKECNESNEIRVTRNEHEEKVRSFWCYYVWFICMCKKVSNESIYYPYT